MTKAERQRGAVIELCRPDGQPCEQCDVSYCPDIRLSGDA